MLNEFEFHRCSDVLCDQEKRPLGGLTPTQACLDKGLTRGTISKFWQYFRRAEAYMGAELRGECVFEGTPDHPVEVECEIGRFRDSHCIQRGWFGDENARGTDTFLALLLDSCLISKDDGPSMVLPVAGGTHEHATEKVSDCTHLVSMFLLEPVSCGQENNSSGVSSVLFLPQHLRRMQSVDPGA